MIIAQGGIFLKKAYGLAAASILMWSTAATVSKLLLGTLSSYQVLCVSAFFAFLFLLTLNIATGNIKKLKTYRPRDLLITLLIGLPGTFFYYVFWYSGTERLPASQAFIINYLWPIMSVVFACILLKEKLTLRKGLAIGISFLGVIIVTGGSLLNFEAGALLGAGLCLLAAISYGLFTALNQKFRYDKRLSMMFFYLVAFLLSLAINAAKGDLFFPTLPQLPGLIWNGIFCMAAASTTWAIALESGKTAKISNLAYITPFLSLVWTFLILQEPIEWYSVLGLFVIVFGILIQLKKK